jgi:type IV secretory pathway VirJ component
MRAAAPVPGRGGRPAALGALALVALVSLVALAAPAAAAKPPAAPAGGAVELQTYGRFGQVAIYRHPGKAEGVVVLLSDDSGWDARAEALARSLQSIGALVIGLDTSYYDRKSERLTQDCAYPAGDFEMLAKLVQKKLELPAYTAPVLAGFGEGATLAYGALAQSPSGTFAGAVSLGFCPDLDASHPLCPGRGLISQALGKDGGFRLQPVAHLDETWLLSPAPTAADAARCGGPAAAEAFVAKVKGAAVIAPPKGNGKRQAAADLRAGAGLKQAFLRVLNDAELARPPATPERRALADLPLLELPVPGSQRDTLAVIVSGDGGWTGLDRDVASLLVERGYPVVGLNTLQYFWTPRTPEGAGADLTRILRTYMAAWNLKEALLIGYSLGGEVLPFMAARLPADLLPKVRLVSLLSPGRTTSFHFELSEWLGHGGGENRPVRPEVVKLKGSAIACIYGSAERGTSLCTTLPAALAAAIELPGSHYLGANPRQVVNRVLIQLAAAAPRKEPGKAEAVAAGGAGGAKPAATEKPEAAPAAKKKTWPPIDNGSPNPLAPPPPPPPQPPPAGTGNSGDAGDAGTLADVRNEGILGNVSDVGIVGISGILGILGNVGWGGAAAGLLLLGGGPGAGFHPGAARAPGALAASVAPAAPPGPAGLSGPPGRRAGPRTGRDGGGTGSAGRTGNAGGAGKVGEETLQYGRFGVVRLWRQTPHPGNVVLFFSGADGWDETAAAMARVFAARDFLLVGIDTQHYLEKLAAQHEACAYTAGSLENLSKMVQKRLAQPRYSHPLLAGYAGGAALAYGALAQAPPNTFRGGIGLALCAALPGGQALCPGHGLASRPGVRGAPELAPAHGVEQTWVAIQGGADRACPAAAAAPLVHGMAAGEMVTVAGVDHAFGRPELWQGALRKAIDGFLAPAAMASPRPAGGAVAAGAAGAEIAEIAGTSALPGLPVIEMAAAPGAGGGPKATAATAAMTSTMAVMLSGDGGWAGVDREVAKVLAGERGVPVVGLDTLEYFWNGRSPAAAGADLERLLRHYMSAWKRDQVVLVGYSLGADVLPFMASRLPPDLLAHVRLIALLGPSHSTPLEIRVKENKASELPVLPELQKLRGRPLLCIGARGEADSLCPEIGALGQSVELEGSHAFSGDYAALADRILQAARGSSKPAGGAGGGTSPRGD